VPGGSAGFSRKSVIRSFSSTCITPKALASSRGTVEAADGHVGAAFDVVLAA
jgi:hypothetical protein